MYTLYKRLIDTSIGKWVQATPFRYYTLPLILWLVIMIVLSSMPGSSVPKISIIQWDKIAHFIEYVVFAFLLGRFLYFRKELNSGRVILFVVLICTTYAVGDELHQYLIPDRDCSLLDFLADILGVFTGVAGFKFIAINDLIPSSEKENIE